MSTGRFWSTRRSQGEVERKQKDRQIPGPCQRTEKTLKYDGKSNTNCSWCPWNGHKEFGKKTGVINNLYINTLSHSDRYHADFP